MEITQRRVLDVSPKNCFAVIDLCFCCQTAKDAARQCFYRSVGCAVASAGSGAGPNHSTGVENARCRSDEASSYSRAHRLSAAGPADGADYAIISQSKRHLLFLVAFCCVNLFFFSSIIKLWTYKNTAGDR